MLTKMTHAITGILFAGVFLSVAGCDGVEKAGTADGNAPSAAVEAAEKEMAEPDHADGRALRREIDALDRQRVDAQAEREALEAELQALSSALDESEFESTRLEDKVRRMESMR